MNLDRDMYLVISDIGDGPMILEVGNLTDMRAAIVAKDIRTGQYAQVLAVLEINPVDHICRDCTHDFQSVIDDHAEALADIRRGAG